MRRALSFAVVVCLAAIGCGDDEETTVGPTTSQQGTGGLGTGGMSSGGMSSGGTSSGGMSSGGSGGTGGMEAVCGNGTLEGTEACDDGNTDLDDGCSDVCAIETGWTCDNTNPSECAPICGDSLIVGTEACDDGNTANDDGCNDQCALEVGWDCEVGPPTTCTAICGDAMIVGTEVCDDGNTTVNDGCSDLCAVEAGWSCMGEPSTCTTGCGDGIVAGSEVCDDGNMAAGDGCDAACALETGWTCNGMPSVCVLLGTDCSNPIAASDGFIFNGTNIAQFVDDYDLPTPACENVSGNTSPDIVFEIALNAGDTLNVYDTGTLDVVTHILPPGACGANACVATSDDPDNAGSTYTATVGGTYSVIVESYSGTPSSTATYDIHFEVMSAASPGVSCLAPIQASDGFQFTGTNINVFGDDYDFPTTTCENVAANASPDILFEIALNAGDTLNVTELGNLDVVIHVLDTGCGALDCAASLDAPETTGVTYTASTTGVHYVAVESFSSTPLSTATFDINFNVAACADGVAEPFELCDDGNTTDGDGCSATCEPEPGYICSGSPSVCTLTPGLHCASPIVASDGFQFTGSDIAFYLDDYDFVDASCENVSTGNTSPEIVFEIALNAGDTLNVNDQGTLDTVTHILPPGGCGIVPCAATWDDPDTTGPTYTATTTGTHYVVVESYGSAPSSTSTFDIHFTVAACGDGVIELAEDCDDGNTAAGDGCSPLCAIEAGYICTGQPSVCVPGTGLNCSAPIVASDGFQFSGANIGLYADDYDFVDASCAAVATGNTSPDIVFEIALNAGATLNVYDLGTLDVVTHVLAPGGCGAIPCAATWNNPDTVGASYTAAVSGVHYVIVESFSAAPSATATYDIHFDVGQCADGVAEPFEGCDDGNTVAGDGCSPTCVTETGYACTDSPSVCVTGTCADPIIVGNTPFQFTGSNIQQYLNDENYNPPATCVDVTTSGGFDLLFRIDLLAGENVRVRELGALDAVVHILDPGQCAGGSQCVGSNQTEATGAMYTASAAGPVYLVLESNGNPASTTVFDFRVDRWLCGDAIVSGPEGCDDGNTVGGDGCSATCTCENINCALGACAGTIITASATGLPVAIPDNLPNSPAIIPISVTGTGTVQSMAMLFEATHPFDADLDIFLVGPNAGPNHDVCTDNGSSGDNFVGTYFRDGFTPITDGIAPFTSTFAPEQAFSAFTGQSVTGTWTLRVGDDAVGDVGTVNNVQLAFCVTP